MTNRPHWSYSAISQYLSCPLRFYFQRVIGLPQEKVSSSLVLGSAVHAALAEYHRTVQRDEPTDTSKLHLLLTDSWKQRESGTRIIYRDGESQDGLIAQGIALWSSPQKVSAGLRITRTFHTRPETGSPGPNDAAHGCKTLRCTRTHSLAPPLDSDSPHRGSTPSSTRRKNFPSARCPSSWLGGSCYR